MNNRIAAALIGTTLGVATFAGSTLAVSAAAPAPPTVSQDQITQVICHVLEDLDLIDLPEVADLVEALGCKDDGTSPTTTSTRSAPSDRGPR